MKKRMHIKVNGVVQGVGFRPFIYNLALINKLKGWVNNNSQGVSIDIEGELDNINKFLATLNSSPPPLSKIIKIVTKEGALLGYSSFTIKESIVLKDEITLISPDISTCKDCIRDILDPKNRRYNYPFTNCTNCGPRFSITQKIPYDRINTTMKKFQMCDSCTKEYYDPTNRRFHAQPNACPDCGPMIFLEDNLGNPINTEEPIKWAVEKLKDGSIFTIKGLTGFNLCCDGENKSGIYELRKRKRRPDKPLAVMMKNLDLIKKYCKTNETEETLLTGIEKPIVLLEKKVDFSLPEEICGNLKYIGVMLPSTPLHELIFNSGMEILIMTSANLSGLPLEYSNEGARTNLSDISDYFLFHNREIYIPLDDSVTRVVDNEIKIIRRARGFVPSPITVKPLKMILACGSNMKNTFTISRDNYIFASGHNGDLENIETFQRYNKNIDHFKKIFSITPEIIAIDMHPDYMSTKFGIQESNEFGIKTIAIQHHHAHIASAMLENHITQKVIGISYDGTGYGIDGKIWGSEIAICDYKTFERKSHLSYIKLPGGDKAVKEPWRIGVSYIYDSFERPEEILNIIYKAKYIPILTMLSKNINCAETSSMGRLFDGVASILGVRDTITYEGQASIELENIIDATEKGNYPYEIEPNSHLINIKPMIRQIVLDKLSGKDIGKISAKFHNTIIELTLNISMALNKETGINKVVLSGGVFQNSFLLSGLTKKLKENSLLVYTNRNFPTNDGGISLGQLIIANELSK